MGLMITDETALAVIGRRATEEGLSPEEVVLRAVEAEAIRRVETERRRAAIAELQKEVASWPRTGLKADKAFFDDLGGGL